jgi:hypothetical protein
MLQTNCRYFQVIELEYTHEFVLVNFWKCVKCSVIWSFQAWLLGLIGNRLKAGGLWITFIRRRFYMKYEHLDGIHGISIFVWFIFRCCQYVKYSLERWDNWWVMNWKKLEGSNRGHIEFRSRNLSWGDWRKSLKSSARITGVPANSRTENLSNTCLGASSLHLPARSMGTEIWNSKIHKGSRPYSAASTVEVIEVGVHKNTSNATLKHVFECLWQGT